MASGALKAAPTGRIHGRSNQLVQSLKIPLLTESRPYRAHDRSDGTAPHIRRSLRSRSLPIVASANEYADRRAKYGKRTVLRRLSLSVSVIGFCFRHPTSSLETLSIEKTCSQQIHIPYCEAVFPFLAEALIFCVAWRFEIMRAHVFLRALNSKCNVLRYRRISIYQPSAGEQGATIVNTFSLDEQHV